MKSVFTCLIILIVILISSCVSKKTYLSALKQAKIKDSLLIDTLKQKNLIINNLSNYIDNMSANGKIPAEDFLPVVSNPPPQCTEYITFDEKKFDKFKSYNQIDSILSSAILKLYRKKIYMAFKDGGFAISTPMVAINNKETKNATELSDNDDNKMLDFFRYLFSKAHEEELFFPDFEYFRCVIFIVSPNIYALGGKSNNGNEVQNWINVANFRLPDSIRNLPLPKHTQVVALLYEFEKNKNLRGQLKILDSKHKLSELESMELIQQLAKYKELNY